MKLSTLPIETAFATTDYLVKVKTAGGGDVLVTLANLLAAIGGFSAWTSWTPTYTTLAIGNGTHSSKFIQVGKTVICRLGFTLGNTSTMGTGAVSATLPVTAASGIAQFTDLGALALVTSNRAHGFIRLDTTTTIDILSYSVSGSNISEASFTPTTPGTWGTGSYLAGTFAYEAA